MPPIPDLFGEIQVHYSCTGGLHTCQNSVGIAISAAPDQAAVDEISNDLAPSYKAFLNGADRYQGLRFVWNDGGTLHELFSVDSAGAGARGAALAAPMSQGLIRKNTGSLGRKNRGRMFIPDITEGDLGDDGVLSGGCVALLQAIADAWMSLPGEGVFGSLALFHDDLSAATEITSMTAENKVATLRHRYRR